ncbi:unnamed protein product [Microthlaspi erraticum]|uniref:Uncharacterized protein n=1 Tax=Microthlaspi erraticum TaxID=1685480 RepID=A0A6D2HMD1_9BRAS|nr:unnamed protein product [Microthlaspi erraticum]
MALGRRVWKSSCDCSRERLREDSTPASPMFPGSSFMAIPFPTVFPAAESKDVPGRALVTWTNKGESRQNGAERSSIEPVRPTARSTLHLQLDRHVQQEVIDRAPTYKRFDRSHAASSIDLTVRSASSEMISQPFDLLGANRLDRTTANRIEPKSTPELFRPIFSHCLGYAVFQSFTLLFIVSEGEEIKPLLFTVWRRFLNPCFAIFYFDSMTFSSVLFAVSPCLSSHPC